MQDDELVLSDIHLHTNNLKIGTIEIENTHGNVQLQVVSSRFVIERPFQLQSQDEIQFEPTYENNSLNEIGDDALQTTKHDVDGDIVVNRRPASQTAKKVITIEHSLATTLNTVGLQVWPGSIFLCDYVLHMHEEFANKVVLELGAGTGLCSIVAAMFASRVLCTDYDEEILKTCQRNVDNNSHLTGDKIKSFQRGPIVRVKQLDWLRNDPFTNDDCDALSTDRPTWVWTEDDLEDANNIEIILASDVIYDTNLTDHFFALIKKLLIGNSNRTLFVSLERRLNFTLEQLDISCPAYDHFIVWTKRLASKPTHFQVQKLPADFSSYLSFERTKYLELWRISSH